MPKPGYQRRNTLRHVGYDYTTAGAYFVTIRTYRGQLLFGEIVDQTMVLNPLGQLADNQWNALAERHPTIKIDGYVTMPNHIHLLLWLRADPEQQTTIAPTQPRKFGAGLAGSLSILINAYKGEVTQKAKKLGLFPIPPLWQNNFWDRIVRVEQELEKIRGYILSNPARWLDDQLHPHAPQNQFNHIG